MERSKIEELYAELEATKPAFIRRKHATGGYVGWKAPHVKRWLDAQDAALAQCILPEW